MLKYSVSVFVFGLKPEVGVVYIGASIVLVFVLANPSTLHWEYWKTLEYFSDSTTKSITSV